MQNNRKQFLKYFLRTLQIGNLSFSQYFMKNNCFLKTVTNEMKPFHGCQKKFIIKIPNSSSKLASRQKSRKNESHAKTLILDTTRKFNFSSGKQHLNVNTTFQTTRNLQHEGSICLSRNFLSPRNYSVNKLKKYRFRKQTISNQNQADFTMSKQCLSHFCKITIFTDDKENQLQPLELKVKVSTTTNLIELLKNKLKNKNVVGFKLQPSNLLLDLYLTFDYCDISYLNGTSLQLSTIQRIACPKVDISCFEIFKCIGSGGFSKVFLCRFKQDGKFYAMKLIDKKFILKHKKTKIVMNERNIMEAINHPFIIKMKFAFQTANNLAFVLQYCPGSQMFSIIKKYKRLSEEMARFYMIEILLGLQYLHSQGIIYRDFKPENILLDIDGHIKIADFGLAKPNYFSANDRAYSFCGSPEYMPPEMIMKQGHSLAVDFYCLGAVLYEFVTGLPPFYSQDTEQIYQGTLYESLSFPPKSKLSAQLKNLLKGLLNKDENCRLGSLNGVKQVLSHPWFGKFSNEQYFRRQVKPPTEFRSINSINLEPQELKNKNQIYVLEARKQQQPEKVDFDVKFEEFYYDHRFFTGEETKRTRQKWFKRKDSSRKLTNVQISRQSLTLLKKIKSHKITQHRMTTKETEQPNDKSIEHQFFFS